MKSHLFILIFIIFTACNHNVNSGNTLELNNNIERLVKSSRKVVSNWVGYQDLENNLKLICNTNALNAVAFKDALKANIAVMKKKIPKAVDTKSVQNRLNSIDKKVSAFCSDIKDDELDRETVQQHLNKIMDAFEDLNIAINKTVSHH